MFAARTVPTSAERLQVRRKGRVPACQLGEGGVVEADGGAANDPGLCIGCMRNA